MSYLLGPRLHFAGSFTADVSTVNNEPHHFKDPNQPAGSGWNKKGTGAWSIDSCVVTGAVFADGTVARTAADDPVVGAALVQNGKARLVDLDSEQQTVSEIWAWNLSLAPAGGGGAAFNGAFQTAPFSDIWPFRFPPTGPQVFDFNMSAFYQSLLTGVTWADLFGSRLLAQLQQTSLAKQLSIKFNVDGFDQTKHVGRIVGTIGAALSGEPAHFVVGRQCQPVQQQGPVWFFPAVVDQQRRKLVADFGNALQTTSLGGPFDSTLNLQIGTAGNPPLGSIPIGTGKWYEQTAGICEFPSDRALTDAELAQLAATPIVVQQDGTTVASEGVDGLHVRADDFVYRMSANDPPAKVTLLASRFGQPLPNTQISVVFDDSQLQGGGGNPPVDTPPSGLTFPGTVMADAQGVASLSLTAGSIKTPRDFIDGQVYGVRYSLPQADPNAGYFNPADFVSVLVWTDFPIPAQPTWNDHVAPILTQYKNLYPVMANFFDLSDYASVVAHKAAMLDVFQRPQEDPHYMPVTRDLSPAKRQMILNWFATTGNNGQPNLGAPVAAVAAPTTAAAAAASEAEEDFVAEYGGKAAALRNRPHR